MSRSSLSCRKTSLSSPMVSFIGDEERGKINFHGRGQPPNLNHFNSEKDGSWFPADHQIIRNFYLKIIYDEHISSDGIKIFKGNKKGIDFFKSLFSSKLNYIAFFLKELLFKNNEDLFFLFYNETEDLLFLLRNIRSNEILEIRKDFYERFSLSPSAIVIINSESTFFGCVLLFLYEETLSEIKIKIFCNDFNFAKLLLSIAWKHKRNRYSRILKIILSNCEKFKSRVFLVLGNELKCVSDISQYFDYKKKIIDLEEQVRKMNELIGEEKLKLFSSFKKNPYVHFILQIVMENVRSLLSKKKN